MFSSTPTQSEEMGPRPTASPIAEQNTASFHKALAEIGGTIRRASGKSICASSVLICGLMLLCGCSVTRGTRKPDGSLVVTNCRLLWASEAVDFTVRHGEFSTRLKIGKSASDDEAVASVIEGVVKGLTRP